MSIITEFLVDGGYETIEEWMEDSDYVSRSGEWFYPDDYPDPSVAGTRVDPQGTIMGAIEACGFPQGDA